MRTCKEILSVAKAEIGTKESPANSNKVKYAEWYGMNGQPWCMMFIQWVFASANAWALLPVKTASCTTFLRAAKSKGRWVTSSYLPGDVVIYDFTGDGNPDHCGIVEETAGGGVVAIEGNTSTGNDANGGEVMRRIRSNKSILGAFRPEYKEEATVDNNPSASHKEGVEWAVKNGILRGNGSGDLMLRQNVTREQLCTMLHRTFELLKK